MSVGSVRLINAVFYAHHGVMKEEHRIGGRYEVDVSMDVNFDGEPHYTGTFISNANEIEHAPLALAVT